MDTLKLNGVLADQPDVAVKTKFENVTPSTVQFPVPVRIDPSAAMVPAPESHNVSPNTAIVLTAAKAATHHTFLIKLPPSNPRNTTQGVPSA